MITVVMPSFYSSELVIQRIEEITKDTPIIIIENSKDLLFKNVLEKKFSNVRVIVPNENLGWGKAINIGMKEAKTEMVFVTQPDVMLVENCVEKLKECIKTFKDFTILTPKDTNNDTFKNYEIYKTYPNEKLHDKYKLAEVDYVDLTWLINKSKINEIDYWDEKIFLYFEAKDFSKRIKDLKKKIFIAENINTFHLGSSSHNKRYDHFSKLNRNWHYNWSKHYFNKKHFGIFFAYRKSLPLLTKLILKFLKSIITFNFSDSRMIFTELYGLFCSMINLPSFYRPYKKIT
tara:strand:- start:386 stop:1252 length:867 start_codon:yes stop_codon:yes gene_type:complete